MKATNEYTPPKLSIVIPVFNKWNFTKACLNDLMQLSSEHEIIIVDNGSSDETNEELGKIDSMSNFLNGKAGLGYFRFEENQGFAKGCNKGYRIATGDNVMFLNNDIRVKSRHEDWTQIVLDALKEDTLVGPTGAMVDPTYNFQFLYETHDPKKPKNYMSGWCLTATRNTWEKLHVPRPEGERGAQIFSEEFGLAYFEDTDLGFRAKRKKMDFEMVEIPVVHFGKISSGQINTSALYSKARQIFINKWGSK